MTTEHRSAVGATWAGIRDLFIRRRDIEPLPAHVRMEGAKVLVTGGTTGLGRAIAEQLAARGATVVTTGRQPRGLPELGAGPHPPPVTFAPVDYADLRQVHALAGTFAQAGLRFTHVIHNAGMVAQRARTTTDGLDEMEQVNVVAPALLTARLLQADLLDARTGVPRMIFVASESHRSVRPDDPLKIGLPRGFGAGGAVAEYGRTKLLLLMLATTLARKTTGRLDVFALCPGAVNSEIAREAPRWSMPLLRAVFSLIFQSPSRAAAPAIYLAGVPHGTEPTGTYLHLLSRKSPSAVAMAPDRGEALWARLHERLLPFGGMATRRDD